MWNKQISSDTKKKWDEFVNKFTPDYVRNKMTIDEYVIGKGNKNKSFCYIVEKGLAEGDTATAKFKEGDDKSFLEIKEELASLIERTQKLKEFEDLESKITGMVKYKIMFIYNPYIMIPSDYLDDLECFVQCVTKDLIVNAPKRYEGLQKALLEYKDKKYHDLSLNGFAVQLYREIDRLF